MSSDIIAKKANSYNGYAVKYSNGKIIEYGISTSPTTGNNYNVQVNFSFSFTNIPAVTASINCTLAYVTSDSTATYNSLAVRTGMINRVSTTSFYLAGISSNSSSGNGDIAWKAESY